MKQVFVNPDSLMRLEAYAFTAELLANCEECGKPIPDALILCTDCQQESAQG